MRGVAIGDLSGDSRADLATANFFGETISVITPSGDNSGWNPVGAATPIIPFSKPSSVATGDLNSDGRNDLVAAHTLDRLTVIMHKADNPGWEDPNLQGGPWHSRSKRGQLCRG
jgi:hypothetical protein